MTEDEFRATIRAHLADNHGWLHTAMQAISDGMSEAMKRSTDRAALLDLALRCALGLMDEKRLTAATRQMLTGPILAAIPEHGGSPIEDRARKHMGG